jgi:hypothetical protein
MPFSLSKRSRNERRLKQKVYFVRKEKNDWLKSSWLLRKYNKYKTIKNVNWPNDTQYNDIRHNDAQRNTKYNAKLLNRWLPSTTYAVPMEH